MQVMTILLVALLFGKDTLLPAIMKKMGISGKADEKSDDIAEILKSQHQLRQHFNDETSVFHKETQSLLVEIRDGIKELNRTHENYEKIGILTRDCIKK